MKPWRWFVGQVARLRRTIAGVVELRRRPADDATSSVDEARAGPPEHWLEKVRRGAPGLLEPSLRQQRGSAEEPATNGVGPPGNDLESDSFEETGREDVEPKPSPAPRRRMAPLLRKILRQQPEPPPNVDEAPLAPVTDVTPREPRPIDQPGDARPAEPPPRRLDPNGRETHEPDRSPAPHEVVELEAEVPARPQPAEQVPAPAPQPTKNGRHAEQVVEEIRTERVWERAVPSPAPRSEPAVQLLPEPAVQRLPEPAVPRPTPRREPPLERRPAEARPDEPFAAIEPHPWPDLPAPVDQPDTDVETALRAWEHQRRLDREQTRL